MSGAVSGVGKIFKKVTKSVVGKVVIGAAAAYFTAGLGASVLGATGLSTSLSPAMGTVLSNALSGVAAGGITSAITGGNVGKGMLLGGLGGAVMGGVQTALGNVTPVEGGWKTPDPSDASSQVGAGGADSAISAGTDMQLSGPEAQPDAVINAKPWQNPDLPQGDVPGATLGQYGIVPPAGATPPVQDMGTIGPAPGVQPPTGAGGLLTGQGAPSPAANKDTGMFGKGGWIERNQMLAGGAVSGIGQGILGMATADAQADALEESAKLKLEAEREKANRIAASHEGLGGLLTSKGNTLSTTPRPTPTQRFDPSSYRGEWRYDPAQGKIVFVPAT